MVDYRRLWRKHYGPIPVDEEGRRYELHHIDGNRNNNTIENLMCVSAEEHLKIHELQGDHAACLMLADRLKLSPELKSKYASASNAKRLLEGTHPFQDPKLRARTIRDNEKRVKNGTHPFLRHNRDPAWQEQANTTYAQRHNRSKLVKQTWEDYKAKGLSGRTLKGSAMGASKTKNTKWYHQLDGRQLRTQPMDPRVEQEGWIEGRFNGSAMAKRSASKYKSKYLGKKMPPDMLVVRKKIAYQKTLTRYSKNSIEQSVNQSKSVDAAVRHYCKHFGMISRPTLVKMMKIYYIQLNKTK